MVFISRVSGSYKLKGARAYHGLSESNQNKSEDNSIDLDLDARNQTEMTRNLGLPGLKKLSASCNELDSNSKQQTQQQQENTENDDNKKGFLRRVFGRKYKKLKRSKSQEQIPETALNISINYVFYKYLRLRSRTAPSEFWQEANDDEKSKRRMAVCEDNEDSREGFSKIVETFVIKKNMDDYGF